MTRDANPFDPDDADRPLMLRCRCGASLTIGVVGMALDLLFARLQKAPSYVE